MNKILLCFLLFPFMLPSQTQKGATPLSTVNSKESSIKNTYAVVIGISDYQDKNIPDLQFANNDAEAFAQWLQSTAGGHIPNDKIQLLINKDATNAAIYLALNWLMEECKDGDQAIIYFSGHGDVETKTIRQNGFLLGHDTPAAVYMAGAVSLSYLQDVITTLSEKNRAKVLIVTDACHSGKLAGSRINGTQITSANLAKQFAGETKILSCQPNEFSIEGEQWGGGRGVFSFHLLDGLTGMADKNGDGVVSLNEIDRYLGDMVPPETAPQLQTPFTVGDRNIKVSYVDVTSLTQLRQTKANQANTLAQINSKGLEEELLSKSDSLTRIQYVAFKKTIAVGNLLEPLDSCAWFYYHNLIGNSALDPLHRLMQRNLAVAFLNEVQKALNALLANDPEEANQWQWNPEKYRQYPEYIDRAMQLLGKENPLYESLKSKKLYFEAYILVKLMETNDFTRSRIDSLKEVAKNKLLQAISIEPNAAYLYYSVAQLYYNAYSNSTGNSVLINAADSMVLWSSKAIELSPAWLLPYLDVANNFFYVSVNELEGRRWLEKATAIDSESFILKVYKVNADMFLNDLDEAEKISRQLIAQRPELAQGYYLLGYSLLHAEKFNEAIKVLKNNDTFQTSIIWQDCPLGFCYSSIRNYQLAKNHALKVLKNKDISHSDILHLYNLLIYNAEISQNYKEALFWADSAILYNSYDTYYKIQALTTKAHILFEQGKDTESESILLYALSLDPTPNPHFIMDKAYLGLIAEKRREISAAEDFFRQAENYEFLVGGLRQCALYHYGAFLMRQNRKEEAKHKWEQIVKEFPRNYFGYSGLALYYADQNNQTLALDMLEKSLDFWYPVPKPILEEPLFKKIRKTKRFKALMLKNFPPGWEKN